MESKNETTSTRKRTWGDAPLDDKQEESESKWYQRFPRFTGEYCGGIIAGFGLGMAILTCAMEYDCIRDFSSLILTFGVFIAGGGAEIARLTQQGQGERNSLNKPKCGS